MENVSSVIIKGFLWILAFVAALAFACGAIVVVWVFMIKFAPIILVVGLLVIFCMAAAKKEERQNKAAAAQDTPSP